MNEANNSDKMDKTSDHSDLSGDSGIVNWHDPKSVIEHNRYMLDNQMSCDAIFVVGEKKEKIGAHKYVLMNQGTVFRSLFTGPKGDMFEFEIPNISADYFWELLKHTYCGDEKLQVSNVVGVLHAADQYDLIKLQHSCLKYLHECLEVNNACYLLVEVRKYCYLEEEKIIKSFIRQNANDVLQTKGMDILSRELLNEVLTLPGLDVSDTLKKEVTDRWAVNHCEEKKQESSVENILDPLQDCFYVYRDDDASHRYVMDSLTSRNLFEEQETNTAPGSLVAKTDETDGKSTISSAKSVRSSASTYSRLRSSNMWADVEQVTRLHELCTSENNDAKQADAISFTVSHNLYLYGFSIYGPKKHVEGKYVVDTILCRKKRIIVLESIHIKGAGVILPVMFERPIKIDKDLMYTLEVYILGPESHMGTNGQAKIQYGPVLFTFSCAQKVKKNRTDTTKGQIPRLYFLLRY